MEDVFVLDARTEGVDDGARDSRIFAWGWALNRRPVSLVGVLRENMVSKASRSWALVDFDFDEEDVVDVDELGVVPREEGGSASLFFLMQLPVVLLAFTRVVEGCWAFCTVLERDGEGRFWLLAGGAVAS